MSPRTNKVKKETPKVKSVKKRDYIFAVGKRKSAVARVRLYPRKSENKIIINEQDFEKYFPNAEFQKIVSVPLELLGLKNKLTIYIKVQGGGRRGQAESVRHGIARVLVSWDEKNRKTLRAAGFLTRDSRKKERKKPGLKRARRAPQWQKR